PDTDGLASSPGSPWVPYTDHHALDLAQFWPTYYGHPILSDLCGICQVLGCTTVVALRLHTDDFVECNINFIFQGPNLTGITRAWPCQKQGHFDFIIVIGIIRSQSEEGGHLPIKCILAFGVEKHF